MANISELPHSELDQLREELREVVEELVEGMPLNSWVIEQTAHSSISKTSPFYSLERELRASPKVVNKFLGETGEGRLRIVTPTTIAIGLYPGGRRAEAMRYGLFSYPENSRYDPDIIKTALGGGPTDVVLHSRINLPAITGRYIGTISPILARKYLQNFSVIDINPLLVAQISKPDTIIGYPLGGSDLLYFCARGEEFLASYKRLVGGLGIRSIDPV